MMYVSTMLEGLCTFGHEDGVESATVIGTIPVLLLIYHLPPCTRPFCVIVAHPFL